MIYLGADHGGYQLKEQIKKYLNSKKIKVIDLGNKKYEPKDDYPKFAKRVAEEVVKSKGKGILICRSGVGVCIVANKIKGIRAAQPHLPRIALKSREDEDTNILCLGADYLAFKKVKKIIDAWLKTNFSREKRHLRRVKQIRRIEKFN